MSEDKRRHKRYPRRLEAAYGPDSAPAAQLVQSETINVSQEAAPS